MRQILALSVLVATLAFQPARAAEKEVVLGADNPGGRYYLYGGGISSWVNEHSKSLRITSQTTRGSVENARLLNSSRIDFGLINAIATYQQRHGVGQFKGTPSEKLRGIAALDSAPLHIVTYPSSGVKMLADLANKRVSIGAPGSGSATTANFLFPLAGLTGKIRVQNLGFSESASNLRDGNVDAFFAASALPLPAVVDLASTTLGARVDRHQRQATDLGARGTPAFFVNGRFIQGAQPIESFRALIDEEKTKAEAKVAAGTPRDRVYAETIASGKTEP